jgi:hypothetical protein
MTDDINLPEVIAEAVDMLLVVAENANGYRLKLINMGFSEESASLAATQVLIGLQEMMFRGTT